MSEWFLGVIAAAVVVMAVVQVAVVMMAARAARQAADLMTRLEQDIRPVMANLQAIATDAARATAVAAAQVDRANTLFADMSERVDQTLRQVQNAVVGATTGGAWFAGLKAVLGALRQRRQDVPRHRPASVEEEDALFIG